MTRQCPTLQESATPSMSACTSTSFGATRVVVRLMEPTLSALQVTALNIASASPPMLRGLVKHTERPLASVKSHTLMRRSPSSWLSPSVACNERRALAASATASASAPPSITSATAESSAAAFSQRMASASTTASVLPLYTTRGPARTARGAGLVVAGTGVLLSRRSGCISTSSSGCEDMVVDGGARLPCGEPTAAGHRAVRAAQSRRPVVCAVLLGCAVMGRA